MATSMPIYFCGHVCMRMCAYVHACALAPLCVWVGVRIGLFQSQRAVCVKLYYPSHKAFTVEGGRGVCPSCCLLRSKHQWDGLCRQKQLTDRQKEKVYRLAKTNILRIDRNRVQIDVKKQSTDWHRQTDHRQTNRLQISERSRFQIDRGKQMAYRVERIT